MPEYIVGLDNCICKNPNVRSRFLVLSRSSKVTGFMMYSPELGMFSCNKRMNTRYFRVSKPHLFENEFIILMLAYRYDIDVHEFGSDRYLSVTVKRYFDLRVEIRREILFFPGDFYRARLSFPYRTVLEPNPFGGCGRSLCNLTCFVIRHILTCRYIRVPKILQF